MFSRRALGLYSCGLPVKRFSRGCSSQLPGREASHCRIMCQALSFTALWIFTTVVMSCALGSQPFRFMALKNICSDGYTHLSAAAFSWCLGASSVLPRGMEDTTRSVPSSAGAPPAPSSATGMLFSGLIRLSPTTGHPLACSAAPPAPTTGQADEDWEPVSLDPAPAPSPPEPVLAAPTNKRCALSIAPPRILQETEFQAL
mmetsp:Transcript_9044/g.23137  ORF Transcript_9044/g.23137 Transcript_9044/m.23137 type:complete len:201 (-) Transcript_9044:197-799(-)